MEYKSIKPNNIGCDCYYKALTCLLLNEGKLEEALSFVEYDFLYNQESFCMFTLDKEPLEYFTYGPLIFDSSPGSVYSSDYLSYVHKKHKGNNNLYNRIVEKSFNSPQDYSLVVDYIIDNTLQPKAVLVNSYELREDYSLNGGRASQYPIEHYLNIFHYDAVLDAFSVIDNYFMFKGNIPRLQIEKAILSLKDVNMNPNVFSLIPSSETVSKKERLRQTIINSLRQEEVVGDRIYRKNSSAIQNLYTDWPKLAEYAYEKFGTAAAQFLSYPHIQFRHQIESYKILLKTLFEKEPDITPFINCVDTLSLRWKQFDTALDLITMRGENIIAESHRLRKYLDRIVEADSAYFAMANRVLSYFK